MVGGRRRKKRRKSEWMSEGGEKERIRVGKTEAVL